MSQPGLRFGLFVAALAVWMAWTLWMARREAASDDVPDRQVLARATARDGVLLALVLLPFVPYVIGVLRFEWGFNELSGLFLVAGFAIGAVSGRSLSETAADFLSAMETMLAAALFVGVARGISVAMHDGLILDTVLHGLVSPLSVVPPVVAAFLMVPIHTVLHFAVPSVSGQAALTMPVMAPLADLLGLSRDAAVIAYQTGAGLSDMLIPTNGALLAMLLAARVPYATWLRFAVPGSLLVALIGLIGIVLAG